MLHGSEFIKFFHGGTVETKFLVCPTCPLSVLIWRQMKNEWCYEVEFWCGSDAAVRCGEKKRTGGNLKLCYLTKMQVRKCGSHCWCLTKEVSKQGFAGLNLLFLHFPLLFSYFHGILQYGFVILQHINGC